MTMRLLSAAIVTVAALLLTSSGGATGVKEGGTFRIAVPSGALTSITAIDPAFGGSQLLAPACGTLMAYPDRPLPAGLIPEAEIAEASPRVSNDGRTYTFTIRKDARFSDGTPVRARAFAHAFERILSPVLKSGYAGVWMEIVGASEVTAGNATTPRGVVANGRTLVLRLTKRVPDLLDRLTGLCAVPPNLPPDPEGAKAPLPSAAPYYVSEYLPGERLVLEQNRFYRGKRTHHVDRFVAALSVDRGAAVGQVESGEADTIVPAQLIVDRAAELGERYGVNKSQFFVLPGLGIRVFHLNTSRPLFRNNVPLRRAVNFAINRTALAREDGVLVDTPTDQYLLPGMPGYRDERIYPLKGSDLRRARALAKEHTRGRKAVLYTIDNPIDAAQAQILAENLRKIGLALEVKTFPSGDLLFEKLATPGEPFDLARVRYFGVTPGVLDCFNGRAIRQAGGCYFSYFNSPKYNRLLDRASRLTGDARYRAYGELDVQLSRDAAPAIPVARLNAISFVSARVGCVVVNPLLDLTAVCLK